MELRRALECGIDALPSPSPVLRRVGAVIGNPESSVADAVEALKLDPVVSGRILRLANSAYVGLPRTVSSLHNAVVLLGLRKVHALVLSTSVGGIAPAHGRTPFGVVDFWRHSVAVGMVCESVARHLKRYEPIDPGEAFCAGLLHDIGKLAVAVCDPPAARSAVDKCVRSRCPYHLAEEREVSHSRAGALLSHRWNFPPDLTAAVEAHHAPDDTRDFARTVAIVHLCDIIVHIVGFQTVPGEGVPSFDDGAVGMVGLEPERLRVIARDVVEDQRRVETMIELVS